MKRPSRKGAATVPAEGLAVSRSTDCCPSVRKGQRGAGGAPAGSLRVSLNYPIICHCEPVAEPSEETAKQSHRPHRDCRVACGSSQRQGGGEWGIKRV